MINIEEALNIIKKEINILGTERVDLISSLNRVLAEDIYSKDTLPPFDKSAMDGYAIKSNDTLNFDNNIHLNVKGLIKAGDYYEGELKSNEAIKIMTGAPLPKGADAVIQIEKVSCVDDKVILSEFVKPDTNIIKMGEEIKVGDLALKKGTLIRPAEIALLASLGYSSVTTYMLPKVCIMSTGDELQDIDSPLEKGKIRNSNESSLKALLKNLGIDALSLGIARDNKEDLKEKIFTALSSSDLVITSGGVSAGDYDFIDDVLKEIGATIKIDAIAIKPGKPVTFAVLDNKFFFGLPGNPLSLITTFEEFIKPTIKNMMGVNVSGNDLFKIISGDSFKFKKSRRKYVYVEIKKENGKYYAYDIGSQCSNHLMTVSRSNGIIIIPEGVDTVHIGDELDGRFIFK
ncbi:gephyrin-like molybdotransferase Glp [Clostridium sp.]|uniref:molybdopterin molybdotransferase MoeA n=1 Tax=Clostridium sp. TaxID=1506 RepID=UPI0034642B8B